MAPRVQVTTNDEMWAALEALRERGESNAALVRRAAEICEKHGRPVADWRTARAILGLPAAA